ncbi:endonuclease MutS2 [Acetivibrio ethanolgignens]|uniref:DNA mismatch repair protein MutS n=1 Tax=Acetivibrio ethanolgignens TaxID=290052 RepID=A0A0V8QFT4_9FIRM|nr:DNA mismatch repair protein MutS [Acetivibrio ethanolgignens]KSV59410.1 DNA mismatch repair protein MutS [Acetivibrio ethanolgignens]
MNIEKQIEFDKIKELWMELAVTERAKDKIKEVSFYLSEGEVRKQLRDTTNSRKLIEKLGNPPLQNVAEVKDILIMAQKGDCLTPYQLERVEMVLVAIRRLKDYLGRGKFYDNPLAYYEENLETGEELREEICRQIRGDGVDDYASKELGQIRSQMIKCEEQMKQRAEQMMRSNKAYMADNYCTYRNGRLCVPVKKEYKLKIAGSVIDKSATGSTLFIEPTSISRHYEELQQLKIREENEVYRILYTLTAMVAASAAVLNESILMIEKLDFILSKGKLSIDLDAVEPSINTERRLVLKDARHPLMEKTVNVPLQFEIGEKVRGIIITGPNTGGKTVAIKTVMLNCMMAQCGLHVTCKEADICMNNSYLCDIGDGQNIAENLSTFSAHIKNVLEVLGEVNKDSFVIMDELGSGTDPTEGMGIAIAILEELRKSGAIFLVTTHYPEVKEYADKAKDIINARMNFDKETLRPTYQVVIGEAGESCAFYIADRLGMPNEMLKTAIKAAYGEGAVENYQFQEKDIIIGKRNTHKISKMKKQKKSTELITNYRRGDSVMVYPDKKIGIVCEPMNEKGVLRVQLPDKKIWINHKRVKLHVAAAELYPEDYDFSIIFETVKNRKIRHDMGRKYTEEVIRYDEE